MVKLVPDVESFKYDAERGCLARENVHSLVNPDDATALSFALDLARTNPDIEVETITLGPASVRPHLEDLVRRGVRLSTLISDSLFAGSDTYATSRILARCLATRSFDMLFSGTRTLDGGTSHVPAQVAETLGIPYLGNVVAADLGALSEGEALVDVDGEDETLRFAVDIPAALGFQYATKRKLPYIPHDAVTSDVNDRIAVVTNRELGFAASEVGFAGSLTAVNRVEIKVPEEREARLVRADETGVEAVFEFLAGHGYLPS
jgi:electron transfer flavoprotein beta subunit